MNSDTVAIPSYDFALPVDPECYCLECAGHIDGGEYSRIVDKTMNPAVVLIDPDDLATTVDSGQYGTRCAQERHVNGGKLFPVFDETMTLKRKAI